MSKYDFDESSRPVAVATHDDRLTVTLQDGRVISTPLAWYAFLADATPEQRAEVELQMEGVWWPQLDEGVSVKGLLLGWRVPRRERAKEAVS